MLCQAAVFLQVLLLNSSICKGFLHQIDWFMLENVHYCQLKYEFDLEESDVLIDVVEGGHYTSFGENVCSLEWSQIHTVEKSKVCHTKSDTPKYPENGYIFQNCASCHTRPAP